MYGALCIVPEPQERLIGEGPRGRVIWLLRSRSADDILPPMVQLLDLDVEAHRTVCVVDLLSDIELREWVTGLGIDISVCCCTDT